MPPTGGSARLLALVALSLLLAGCADDEPLAPKLRDETTVSRVHLVATLEREGTRPGEALLTNLHLTNQGTALLYETTTCSTSPWTFEIRAQNGTLVGPLGPRPSCVETAPAVVGLPPNEAISHGFSWDANVKRYDGSGAVAREPVPPGLYTLRAEALVMRDGVPIRPAVEVVFRVVT